MTVTIMGVRALFIGISFWFYIGIIQENTTALCRGGEIILNFILGKVF